MQVETPWRKCPRQPNRCSCASQPYLPRRCSRHGQIAWPFFCKLSDQPLPHFLCSVVSSCGDNLSTSRTLYQGSGAMIGLDPWGPCLQSVAEHADDGVARIVPHWKSDVSE